MEPDIYESCINIVLQTDFSVVYYCTPDHNIRESILQMQADKYHIDMCRGPLFSKIVLFSVPLILSGILQLLFNAADLIVIGHFAPHEAMAAVGATTFITSLIVNVFIGLSIGTNVLVANYLGAKDRKNVSRAAHTAIMVSLTGGVLLTIAGLFISKPLLVLTATPDNILLKSCIYMWIYCSGLTFILLYNFGSAIMRAAGDTRRPLYYLIIAGIINVLLNLLFVLVFHLEVAGVALATVISQMVAAYLVIRNLTKARDACRIKRNMLRINGPILRKMLWIGLPAGLQGAFFSISNLIIQSSINSFGSVAMAGSTAAISLEGIVYVGAYSYHQTVISFTGQNFGAKKYGRIRKSILYCMICSITINLLMGFGFYWAGQPLLAIYNPDPEVIAWGILRMKILFTTYFLCAIMDIVSGALRGLGHSILPAVVTMLGVCVLRVFWTLFIFPLDPTMENLMLSYPISWGLTAAVNGAILLYVCRKLFADASGSHYATLSQTAG